MSNYLKPQTPIELNNNYIYPLTTVDQVIAGNGERLNSLFKKTIKENVTLNAANWSDTKPYIQTVTLTYSVDDYDVDANVAYGNGDNAALHAAAGCLSYIKKNHKEITFYCLKNKPNIDISIEITGTCRNTIATVEDGVKLNFKVVGGTTEPSDPSENMIWVNTDVEITGWSFTAEQPENMAEGEVWFLSGGDIFFNALKKNNITLTPFMAKQIISGALTDVPAKIYKDSEWKDLIADLWFFKNGSGAMVEYLTRKGSGGSIVVDTNKVSISYNGVVSGSDVVWYTAQKHDLTKYNKLKLSAMLTKFDSSQHYVGFGVKTSTPTTDNYADQNLVAGKEIRTKGTTMVEYELDISSLSGEYYIAFCAAACTVEFTDFRAVM